jgi:pre-mRNA-splicing factor SYF1
LILYSALLLVAADGNQPVQMKLHKSLRLWTFYVDLEESLGNLESTREVYERILDLRIATPQVIINYAYFLEVWSNIYVIVQ